MELKYIVLKEDDNKKVGIVIKDKLNVSSRLLNRLKMNEKILVNKRVVFSSYLVHEGDIVEVDLSLVEKPNLTPQNIPLDILYEDDWILAVNKIANMVVHPCAYHPDNTLSNGVQYYLKDKIVRPINRLDKDTSGIVLFAKCEYIQELLVKENTISKEYIAICEGKFDEEAGTINAPIARENGSIMKRCISSEGQNAITHYEVIKYDEKINISFIKIKIETGRTHQIRVHLTSIGHPILGDDLYGNKSDLIQRQALHAYKLSFLHPILNKEIIIEAPIPEDINRIIKKEALKH